MSTSLSQPITAETLQDLQAKISKARKSLTKLLNDHDKATYDLDLFENNLFLDFVLKRNEREFHGSNDTIRKAELTEAQESIPEWREKSATVEKLKRDKRKAGDDLADLESQFKIDLAVFEDTRHKANRAVLGDLLRMPAPVLVSRPTDPTETQPNPVAAAAVTVAVETVQEAVAQSFYEDLG